MKAIFWDFGGVVTSSPFEAFNRYEAEHGLPRDFIRSVNATDPEHNAWARLERSDIGLEDFDLRFAEESESLGYRVPGSDVLRLLSGDLRPRMVRTLRALCSRFYLACLTNNVRSGEGPGMQTQPEKARAVAEVMELFEFVQESSQVGIRKPEPEFYLMACERAGIAPEEIVYLDDLGINLKPARALGMTTIKVVDPDLALDELNKVIGGGVPD